MSVCLSYARTLPGAVIMFAVCLATPAIAADPAQPETKPNDALEELLRDLERKAGKPDAGTPGKSDAPEDGDKITPTGTKPDEPLVPEAMEITCAGHLVATGTFLTLPVPPEDFAFQTMLDPASNTHRVTKVTSGALYRLGGTYKLSANTDGSMTLRAESTSKNWSVKKLRYVPETGALSAKAKPAPDRQPRVLKFNLAVEGTCRRATENDATDDGTSIDAGTSAASNNSLEGRKK